VIYSLEFFRDLYKVDDAQYTDQLATFLEGWGEGLPTPPRLLLLKGLNTDSGAYAIPATFTDMDVTVAKIAATVDEEVLFEEMAELRVIKTKREIALLRHINVISNDAHIAVMSRCAPGMREFQLESLFRHWSYFVGGCRNASYTSICGCGGNSAVLHYGHAGAPNSREIQVGDMCLLDMGAEFHCYGSDITCSFPANGKFTEQQRGIYETVLAAQLAVMAAMKPGVHWKDMHGLANRVTCEKLKDLGLLRGEVDEMMEHNIGGLFQPHGLGHLMGIDTHDVGGIPKDVQAARDTRLGWKSLRLWRELREGMVLTVEPGVYFNQWLLDRSYKDPKLAPFLVKEELDKYAKFGGVRLEDDVLVTADGIENMTLCPRTIDDIEGVMSGAITTSAQLSFKGYYHRSSK